MRAMASAALMKVTTAAPTSPLCRSILGMRVHATSYDDASSRVMAWAEGEDRRRYVCVTTVHTVMEAHDDVFFKRIVNDADLVTPDGMPLVGGPHPVRWPRLSEAGSLDGGPSLAGERGHAGRGRRFRFPGRQQGAGAALDAGPGSGMGLPPGLRATAALVALSVAQPAVRPAVRSAVIEASLDLIISGGNTMKKVLVTGAGGFIGHHLTKFLVERGYWVRGVDVKLPEYEATAGHEFELLDLRRWDNCLTATRGVAEDYGLETRTVRFHNIFGPLGTYDGGREKSPAAICRKIALAKDEDVIDVWGDGKQTRSYCYIDDCVEGIYRLMRSDFREPLNLGQDRMITIDELVDIVAKVAGKHIAKQHDLSKPQGVRGRNSDNSLLRKVLDWEPVISLEEGLGRTYEWIRGELVKSGRVAG